MNLRPALLLTALLTVPVAALAQPPGDAPRHGMHSPPSPERLTERMSRDLGLDEAQSEKLRALNERHAADLKRLREDHEKGLRGILTPEQWTKFEAERDARHERMRERRREHRDTARPPA